jgi:hypothetical protein
MSYADILTMKMRDCVELQTSLGEERAPKLAHQSWHLPENNALSWLQLNFHRRTDCSYVGFSYRPFQVSTLRDGKRWETLNSYWYSLSGFVPKYVPMTFFSTLRPFDISSFFLKSITQRQSLNPKAQSLSPSHRHAPNPKVEGASLIFSHHQTDLLDDTVHSLWHRKPLSH